MPFKVLSLGSADVNNNSETLPQSALRNVSRTAARVTENILGLPGDIAGGVLGLTNYGIEKLTGQESPLPKSTFLPTSTDIKQKVTKPIEQQLLPKNYLEPQGKGEKLADEFFGDLSTLLLPVKGKIPFKRALAIAGFGNAAGFLSDEAKISDAKPYIKNGTMLLTNFAANAGRLGSLRKYAQSLPTDERIKLLSSMEQTSRIHNFLNKKVGFKDFKFSPLTLSLLGITPKKLATVGGLYGAGYAEKAFKALAENSNIRKYYTAAMYSASKELAPTTLRYISKLNEEINKVYPGEENSTGRYKVLKIAD